MESKIKSLAISQHLVLRSIPEILFSDKKSENLTDLAEWSLNFEVLSEILNIELKVKDLFHKYHYDRMISSYLSSSIENEKLLNKIGENFGNEVLALYGFIISIIALNFTSSICGKIIESAIDKERRSMILNEVKLRSPQSPELCFLEGALRVPLALTTAIPIPRLAGGSDVTKDGRPFRLFPGYPEPPSTQRTGNSNPPGWLIALGALAIVAYCADRE
jgi:hypothetical protein